MKTFTPAAGGFVCDGIMSAIIVATKEGEPVRYTVNGIELTARPNSLLEDACEIYDLKFEAARRAGR